MRYLYIILFILWNNLAIAAQVLVIVDKQAITTVDVDKRIEALKLVNPSLVSNDNLRYQILNNLISEELFLNEANHLKISIEEEEVSRYFYNKQRENNYTDQQIKTLMENKSLWKQVKSQLLWSKLVGLVFYNKVKVSDAEIRDEQKVRKGDIGKVSFKQIIFNKIDSKKFQSFQNEAQDCQSIDNLAKKYNFKKPYKNTLLLSELNDDLQYIIRKLPENRLSDLINTNIDKQAIMVCSKEIINKPISTEEIREELNTRKITAEAQKYLAELKKRIYIEYISPTSVNKPTNE